jgi:hypothetical protein
MSLIQAYNYSEEGDPVNVQADDMIQFLGKMPGVTEGGPQPASRAKKPGAK